MAPSVRPNAARETIKIEKPSNPLDRPEKISNCPEPTRFREKIRTLPSLECKTRFPAVISVSITVADTGPLFPLQSTSKEEVAVKALFQTMVEHTATTQRNSPRHFSACSGFYNFAGLGRKGLLAKNIEQRGRRTRTKTGQWRPQFVARRLPLPAFLGRFRPWFHFGRERKAFTFRSCLKLPY